MLKISCIDTNVKVAYSVTLNISITISQQIGDKIAFIRVHRIASSIEMHYVMVSLLLFKGHTFYCARPNRVSSNSSS